MEFTIRTLVVIVLIIIVFVVLVALISGWGGESANILKGMTDWFKQLVSGQASLPKGADTQAAPAGSSGIAGIAGNMKTT